MTDSSPLAKSTQTADSSPPLTPSREASLLGNTLSVPDTDAALIVDDSLLTGELGAFQTDNGDKGTLRLLSAGLSVQRGDSSYLILPAEVLRVSGVGGVYLILLEQTGATFSQRDAQKLGSQISLLRLESDQDLISATTVDSNLGKFPDTQAEGGGVTRFRLEGARLIPSR